MISTDVNYSYPTTTAASMVALFSSRDCLVSTTDPVQVLSSRAHGASCVSRKESCCSRLQLLRVERVIAVLAVNLLVAPETAVHDPMHQNKDAQDSRAKAAGGEPNVAR